MTLGIMLGYIGLLLCLGVASSRLLRRTSGDYFVASRGIGPFMLLMSIFGTTMTSFALVGSTGQTFLKGIGIYGLLASWSGIVHSACFFLIGVRVWKLGKKYGYLTQLSFFRDRYRSDALVLLLFPILVGFVLVYVLMGVVGAGHTIQSLTPGTFDMEGVQTRVPLDIDPATVAIPVEWRDRLRHDPVAGELVASGLILPQERRAILEMVVAKSSDDGTWAVAVNALLSRASGAIPYWAGMGFICLVVVSYVFLGGMRATAWANTFQTLVFMIMGVVAFVVITRAMGGPVAATAALLDSPAAARAARGSSMGQMEFLTYLFIPASAAMFPHLFQHWLTARRASSFKLTVVAHPVCILVVWAPCVLIGMWAAAELPADTNPNAVLGIMVSRYSGPVLGGFIGAGILAAIMSSMDSQFLCLSSLFTNDIVVPYFGRGRITDRQKVLLGRIFVLAAAAVAFTIGLFDPGTVFQIGVWCFTGFAGLVPIAVAALYWRRSNKYGAIASVIAVAVCWIFGRGISVGGTLPVTLMVAISTTVLVVVTLLTPPPQEEIVERFFGATRRPE